MITSFVSLTFNDMHPYKWPKQQRCHNISKYDIKELIAVSASIQQLHALKRGLYEGLKSKGIQVTLRNKIVHLLHIKQM